MSNYKTSIVVHNADNVVIGYASNHGCSRDCRDSRPGYPIHAIPRGFATTLNDYHFASFDDAIAALLLAAYNDPAGLQRAIDITASIDEHKSLEPPVHRNARHVTRTSCIRCGGPLNSHGSCVRGRICIDEYANRQEG